MPSHASSLIALICVQAFAANERSGSFRGVGPRQGVEVGAQHLLSAAPAMGAEETGKWHEALVPGFSQFPGLAGWSWRKHGGVKRFLRGAGRAEHWEGVKGERGPWWAWFLERRLGASRRRGAESLWGGMPRQLRQAWGAGMGCRGRDPPGRLACVSPLFLERTACPCPCGRFGVSFGRTAQRVSVSSVLPPTVHGRVSRGSC